MSCQDWELKLAQDEIGPEVEAHLAGCPACRALAEELAANSVAMRGLGEEVMPPVVLPRRSANPWRWASAIAAMLVVGFGLWQVWGPVGIRTDTVTVRPSAEPPKPRVEPAMPVITPVRFERRPPRRVAPRERSWQVVGFSKTAGDEETGPIEQALVRKASSNPDVVIYWLIESKKEELEP